MLPPFHILPGSPDRPGVTWTDANAVNLAVFSTHAAAVDFCLFDREDPAHELGRIRLPGRTGDMFHGEISGELITPGMPYGFRVHGPYLPENGHVFNPHKLLGDPYARQFAAPSAFHRSMLPGRVDSGPHVTKAVLPPLESDVPTPTRLETPWEDTMICELHVKGYTRSLPHVPEGIRGTYAGLAHPSVLDHLKALGITAVQLLPVHQHLDDGFLLERGLVNYWGYNTLGFFAPEARYAADPANVINEFKSMVEAFHQAGIEVILDVVYNHTCEGGWHGPMAAFRGFDNLCYYRTPPTDQSQYYDVTGCGNSLDLNHPRVLQLVVDSLRYWVEEMGVDGFRFDLAVTLGREPRNFTRRAGFFKALRCDPVLSRVKLIAEPWDLGRGGYQVGNFPNYWSELNGKFRDATRRFWRGDKRVLGEMATRLTGSEDLFRHNGRSPLNSINFITSHDGFTLRDLVSYNEKHNLANGEENRDGDSHNQSFNHGIEGETDDPVILELRARQQRNFLTTLFLSQGVPFLTAGDEMNRTQGGNNNAYCQDNEISWLNWDLDESAAALRDFVLRLVELRHRHRLFRRSKFLTGLPVNGGEPDISWRRADGARMTEIDWGAPHYPALSFALECGIFMALNASHEDLEFALPEGKTWHCEIDTAHPEKSGVPADGPMTWVTNLSVQVWESEDCW
ncbi:MAG: glycogen debranching protein GlgX [Verrucomicrobiales bacterium]|nr:glycogen debranching protein GlgX [Verrucomicrobiales bacterium]